MKYLLIVFSVLAFTACKCSKAKNSSENSSSSVASSGSFSVPAADPKENIQDTKNQNDPKSQLPDTIRLVVSLISIGEGTDQQAPAMLNAAVQHFSEQNGKMISFLRIPWGREGEQDYCYNLKELDVTKQAELIENLRVTFKDHPLVQIIENMKNRFKR